MKLFILFINIFFVIHRLFGSPPSVVILFKLYFFLTAQPFLTPFNCSGLVLLVQKLSSEYTAGICAKIIHHNKISRELVNRGPFHKAVADIIVYWMHTTVLKAPMTVIVLFSSQFLVSLFSFKKKANQL